MDRVAPYLPESLKFLVTPGVLLAFIIGSFGLFVASLVGVPWFVARMPADYFSRHERRRLGFEVPRQPMLRLAAKALKNLLGLVLLVLGVAMLVLPGQGLITVFASLVLLDFPGKRRLERRLVSIPAVLRAINRLRRRAGRPPLESFHPPDA